MIRYSVTTHVDPMANSHVPMMTIICTWGPEFRHFAYQAVPVPADKTTLVDQEVLAALFKEHKRFR